MRKKIFGYKTVILILSILVIIEAILIVFLLQSHPKKITKAIPVIKGRIAIVLDDWGYNLNNLETVSQIRYPITAAVLPNLTYSRQVSEGLHGLGFEIVLHLPMEPHERKNLEQNTVKASMDEATIKDIIEKDLADIPYAKGASNHMGSLATEDLRMMDIVFRQLKSKQLYFLDSVVSSRSVGPALANKLRLAFIKRDIFIDNKEEPGYILNQIRKLKSRARFYGRAVGIGHDRKVTLGVLKEAMPQLEKEGYKFVFVSELVK